MKKSLLLTVFASLLILTGCGHQAVVNNDPQKNNDKIVDNNIVSKDNLHCTQNPTPTEIGRDIYPIWHMYKHLNFLGQIFTASDCEETRMNEIFGVQNGKYSLGSTIWLKDTPSEELIKTFELIGFVCGDKVDNKNCVKWQLWDVVRIDDLLKLEPFSDEFEADDCINCG